MAIPVVYPPPAGVSALGTAEIAPRKPLPPPPVIRADRIRYQDQHFLSMTKDRDPTDAAVVEALWRVRGSGAAVANTGARFLDLDKLGDQAPTIIANDARNALARLIRRGDITLKSVNVQTGPDWAELTVVYVNNRTASEKRERTLRKRFPEEIEDGAT